MTSDKDRKRSRSKIGAQHGIPVAAGRIIFVNIALIIYTSAATTSSTSQHAPVKVTATRLCSSLDRHSQARSQHVMEPPGVGVSPTPRVLAIDAGGLLDSLEDDGFAVLPGALRREEAAAARAELLRRVTAAAETGEAGAFSKIQTPQVES